MLVDQIARANRAADSLLGGVSVRDFAAREFPREDYRWVVASARRTVSNSETDGHRWGRVRRWFGFPGKTELTPETTPEPPAPA